MAMFLIQSLLWLLAAFLLGYGIGRWLKGVFCKRRAMETQTKLETETSHLRVPVTTAAVATGTSATAALARSREPVRPTVTVKQPEVKTPVVTAKAPELKATVTPLKTAELKLPKADLDLKAPEVTVTVPKVEVKAPDIELPKVDIHAPKLDLDKPNLEVKLPNIDLPKVELDLPKLDVSLPRGDLDLPKVDVKTPSIDLPTVDLDAPEIHLPKVDLDLPKIDIKAPTLDLPKVELAAPKLNLPKLDLDLPKVDVNLPKIELPKVDLDLPKLDVELPKVEANLPQINTPHLEVKDIATGIVGLGAAALGVAAVKLQTPDRELDLTVNELAKPTTADLELKPINIDLPEAKIDLSAVEWRSPQASVDAVAVNVPPVEVDLPEAKLPSIDIGHTSDVELPKVELGTVQTGLVNPDWLVSLKAAALAQGNTILADAVDQALKPTSKLSSIELGSLQAGLSPEFLETLKKAAAGAGIGAVVAKVSNALADTPKPVDESDFIEGAKTAAVDLERANDLLHVEIGTTGQGLNPEFLGSLKTASHLEPETAVHHTTVKDVLVHTAADTLAAQPKPVDESDLIEAGKNVAEAVLNPAGLTVTEIGNLGHNLNTDALTALTVAAAGAATVTAVKANLQSGAQPMIVDESDAIEAIKLAWDGELSPAELAALEHTLILRPGETGRLGLVTCSVPGANCVSLGGLEGNLQAGDAMRSNLFNMAVTHNDDGNYVFSSLSKWMPDWLRSGDFSKHTDELTYLVWDNDPSVVEHAAGYQLTLREGQYGDLGLVSCAVNEPGSVSLGGIVGSIADGQTAVSKLYGIFVERAGEVYTFKQFTKPVDTDSWLASAKAAAVAVGVGVAAQATGAVDAVKEALMPVTRSTTTDRLEPDLAWSEDKLRINMQRLIEESHDRRGSKLVSQLWDSDSGYDCSILEGEESLVLKPGLYGKLGSVHCGVTKPGRVVVSGDVSALAEGEGVLFHLYNIVVCRDDEDNYRFERLKDLV